jgi:PQQ-like domain
VPAPDHAALVAARCDPVATVAALRDPAAVSWAFDQLRGLGRDAIPLLAPLLCSRCSLDRIAAELLTAAIDVDAGALAPPVPNGTRLETLVAEHPDAPTASSWLLRGVEVGGLAEAQRAAAARATALRDARGIVAAEPQLAGFWQSLEETGWLRALSAEEIDELRLHVLTAFQKDPCNLHYVLAGAVFDGPEILNEDATDAVGRFAAASRGRFAPQRVSTKLLPVVDEDELPDIASISFTLGGRRRAVVVDRDHGVDLLHAGVNDALAATNVPERFFALPVADGSRRIAFTEPDVYARALASGVIPGPDLPAEGRPRRLRRRRSIPLFPTGASFLHGQITIVETDDGVVRLDAPEFAIAWRSSAPGFPIQIVDGRVLVRRFGRSAEVSMLTLDRGEQVWQRRATADTLVRVWRELIVIFTDPIEFVRPETGETVRQFRLPAHDRVDSYHDFALLHAGDRVAAIDLATGAPLWPGAWPKEVVQALSPEEGIVSVVMQNGGDRVLVVKGRARLSQIRFNRAASAPEMMWEREFAVRRFPPTLAGDRLFAFQESHFRCLDLITGGIVYDRAYPDLGDDTTGLRAVVQGDLIPFGSDLGIRVFRLSDGALMARYDGPVMGTPTLVDDRYVVIGHDGWLTEFA